MAVALSAAAQTCATTDGPDNCVRFLGCIGEGGRWFDGISIGRGTGSVQAITSDGIACVGTFQQQTGLFGTAQATCSDGIELDVLFTYQDSYTGTALGHGKTSDGQPVKTWSGNNILDFLRAEDPNDEPRLPCGSVPLLLSQPSVFLGEIRRG